MKFKCVNIGYFIHGPLKLAEILPAIGLKHSNKILNFDCVELTHHHCTFHTQLYQLSYVS